MSSSLKSAAFRLLMAECRKKNTAIEGKANHFFTNLFQGENYSIEIERTLRKLQRFNYCVGKIGDNYFLKRFSLEETNERFEYFYHWSNLPPEVVLNKGLSPRYNLSSNKPFGPLIFIGNTPNKWIGEYCYRIKIRQKVYYDTNLNWKRKEGHWAFCVKNKINAEDITLYQTNLYN
jgi:hypothetical protein